MQSTALRQETLETSGILAASDILMPELDSSFEVFKTSTELFEKIHAAKILIVRSQQINALLLGNAKCLKLIIRQGAGTDNIDVEFAQSRGIAVENTPLSAPSVAELAFAFMLASSRDFICANSSMRGGVCRKELFLGSELFGKTLGIVGLGRIGRNVARIAEAFGMKVMFYDPFVEEARLEKKFRIEELLKEADFVSLHVPLTKETIHLINPENARLFKKGAVLINTSRGQVVQPDALEILLGERILKTACLDVHYTEPEIPKEILGFKNVLLTPHIGGNTADALERSRQRIKEIVCANEKLLF